MENKFDIDKQTGLFKNVHIEYFLGEKSLGKTMVSEMSLDYTRIKEAKNIGIDYYDRFILDNGRMDSKDIKMLYGGVLEQFSDFKKSDDYNEYK